MKITDADRYARRVMDRRGLKHWAVIWSDDTAFAGRCHPQGKYIEFSRVLVRLNSKEVFRELVLHEIAHAWTPHCGHNLLWQTVVMAFGGQARADIPMKLALSERDRRQLRVKFNPRDVAILGGDPSL